MGLGLGVVQVTFGAKQRLLLHARGGADAPFGIRARFFSFFFLFFFGQVCSFAVVWGGW